MCLADFHRREDVNWRRERLDAKASRLDVVRRATRTSGASRGSYSALARHHRRQGFRLGWSAGFAIGFAACGIAGVIVGLVLRGWLS